MYGCWSILSIVQIYMNRYLRHKWRWRQLVHTIVGTLSTILTIGSACYALYLDGYHVERSYHSYFGIGTLGLVGMMGLLGIATVVLRTNKCIKMEWKTP